MRKTILLLTLILFTSISSFASQVNIIGRVSPEKGTTYQQGIYLVLHNTSINAPDRVTYASLNGEFRFDAVNPTYQYTLTARATKRMLLFTPSVLTITDAANVGEVNFVYFIGIRGLEYAAK